MISFDRYEVWQQLASQRLQALRSVEITPFRLQYVFRFLFTHYLAIKLVQARLELLKQVMGLSTAAAA